MNTFTTFRVIFITALISLAIAPIASHIARKMGLVDVPGSAPHKKHGDYMPIAGGIVIYITVISVNLLESLHRFPEILPIIAIPSIVFLFGLWDDWKDLSPLWKFAGQLLATILLILSGVHVRLFTQNWINYTLTIFWIIGVTNAYNFVDSMDGLAIGLAAMASALFMLVTIDSQQINLSLFSTILLGACIGSFYYNAPPAKLFLGDSGSQFLGFTLGALGIAYNPLGFERLASWYVPILLIGVPIFDTTLVVFSRLRRGKSIFKSARDHTFHRLVALGMSSNRAVLTMHMISLLLGCLAFIALDLPPLIANGIFALILILGFVAIVFLDNKKTLPDPT